MFRTGGRDQPVLLVLFTGWVLSPFAALILGDVLSRAWPVLLRATLHVLTLMVALFSLAMYAGAIPMPAGARPAAVYLMVPLGSWLIIAIVIPAARFAATRRW